MIRINIQNTLSRIGGHSNQCLLSAVFIAVVLTIMTLGSGCGTNETMSASVTKNSDDTAVYSQSHVVQPHNVTSQQAGVTLPPRTQKDDDLMAREAFNAVNIERMNRRLPPLTWDDRVAKIAKNHAAYLASVGKLDHVGANRSTIRDRMASLRWTAAGENLAMNKGYVDPIKNAIEGWIRSSGHAANMFSSTYRVSGMAVVRSRNGTYFFVQNFMTPLQ